MPFSVLVSSRFVRFVVLCVYYVNSLQCPAFPRYATWGQRDDERASWRWIPQSTVRHNVYLHTYGLWGFNLILDWVNPPTETRNRPGSNVIFVAIAISNLQRPTTWNLDFLFDCLISLFSSPQSILICRTTIKCPECRRDTIVPASGLPVNYKLKGLDVEMQLVILKKSLHWWGGSRNNVCVWFRSDRETAQRPWAERTNGARRGAVWQQRIGRSVQFALCRLPKKIGEGRAIQVLRMSTSGQLHLLFI